MITHAIDPLNHINQHWQLISLTSWYKATQYLNSKLTNDQQLNSRTNMLTVHLWCETNDEIPQQLHKTTTNHQTPSIIINCGPIGLYEAWNIGITTTKSTYIANSNTDDHWHPDYITKMTSGLAITNTDIISSKILITDQPNQNQNWKIIGELPNIPYPHSTAGPSPLWKRKLHDDYGLFNQQLKVIGDAVWWETLLRNNVKFGTINDPLVLYYLNPESLERRRAPDGKLLRETDETTHLNGNNQ